MWNVLEVYGVGGRLMVGVEALYRGVNACDKVKGKVGGSSRVQGRV